MLTQERVIALLTELLIAWEWGEPPSTDTIAQDAQALLDGLTSGEIQLVNATQESN